VASIRHARDLYNYVWAFALATGFLALLSLFVFRMSNQGGSMRIAGGYSYDANDIGLVCLVGIAVTLLAMQATRGLRNKALCVLIMVGAARSWG
jgi:hypothetical protein